MQPQPLHAVPDDHDQRRAAMLAALSVARTEQPPPPRTPIGVAWAIALLVHVVALLVLDAGMERAPAPNVRDAIDIVLLPPEPRVAPPLIDTLPPPPSPRAPPAAAAPEPPAMPARPAPSPAPSPAPDVVPDVAPDAAPVVSIAPSAPVETSAEPEATASALRSQRITLYDPDGRLRVPAVASDREPAPVASYIPVPRELPPWEGRRHDVVYEATLLEPFWKPDGETLLEEFARLNTVSKTFRTPWGTKVTCSWVLIIGGCAW